MARKSSSKSSSRRRKSKSGRRPTGKYAIGRTRDFYAGPKSAFEKKFKDVATQVTAQVSGGVVAANFFNMQQGNDPNTRIGNKITVTNINMRGIITSGSLNSDTTAKDECPTFRIVIGIDKQANGGVPVTYSAQQDGILQGIGGGTYADCLQFRNMFNLERFTILKDKLISTRSAGSGSALTLKIDMGVPFKFSWKGMLPVLYNANTGLNSDIRSNNLFVAIIPDKLATLATSTNATVEWVTRVKYIDA